MDEGHSMEIVSSSFTKPFINFVSKNSLYIQLSIRLICCHRRFEKIFLLLRICTKIDNFSLRNSLDLNSIWNLFKKIFNKKLGLSGSNLPLSRIFPMTFLRSKLQKILFMRQFVFFELVSFFRAKLAKNGLW